MSAETKENLRPPYVAYATLTNFINSMKETSVPDRIDKSVLRNMSGANQSYLLSAMRFLGLIKENGQPTQSLITLVKASPDEAKGIWANLVQANYGFMFDGSINLESATEAQFQDKFRALDLNGDTLRKALSLFTLLAELAGIKLSPHLKGKRGPSGSTNGPRRTVTRRRSNDDPPPPPPAAPQTNSLQEMLLKKFPDFDPKWDDETQKKWFSNFEQFMKIANAPKQ
jgi:hypothetical protein